ncbi:MAG: hypothetical protein GDA50_07110 [Alphaproteobacteria bacterium GM202ARS2]|nr:hypothetical protein [Alphaproteobacteria bacterium GM202ARS2]
MRHVDMLMRLEWDAIIIGAVLAYLVGWALFTSDKLLGGICRNEGCINPKNIKVTVAADFVATVLLATLVAIVLTAFGGASHVGADWLCAVVFLTLVVGSGALAADLWQGRSTAFMLAVFASYAVSIVIMALAYVYVEKFI